MFVDIESGGIKQSINIKQIIRIVPQNTGEYCLFLSDKDIIVVEQKYYDLIRHTDTYYR